MLHPALVGFAVTFPSIRLLFRHCMFEHDTAIVEGVQYKLAKKIKSNQIILCQITKTNGSEYVS